MAKKSVETEPIKPILQEIEVDNIVEDKHTITIINNQGIEMEVSKQTAQVMIRLDNQIKIKNG